MHVPKGLLTMGRYAGPVTASEPPTRIRRSASHLVLMLAAGLGVVGSVDASEHGEAAYGKFCIACHGARLQGGTGPSLVDSAWKHGSTRTDIERAIRMGFPDAGMPAWGSMMAEDDIAAIAAFVVAMQGEQRVAKQPADDVKQVERDAAIAISDRVVIDRHHVKDLPPKTLSIGFPQGGRLAIDPGTASILRHWTGRFIDIGPLLNGRGMNYARPGRGTKTPLLGGLTWADGRLVTVAYRAVEIADQHCVLTFALDGIEHRLTLAADTDGYRYHLQGPAPDQDLSLQVSHSPKPFLLATPVPAQNFSVRWTGAISVPESGSWRVGVETDDGARLSIGDELLVDQWRNRAATWDIVDLDLETGRSYPITFEYYQLGGGAVARLAWQPPGGEGMVAIPTEHLHPQTDDASGGGLTGTYYLGTRFQRRFAETIDPIVDFSWATMADLPEPSLVMGGKADLDPAITCTGGALEGDIITLPAGRAIDLVVEAGGTRR